MKKEKIIIAMSGGIDSSVAAALLKEAKYDVVGVFMRLNGLKSSIKSERKAREVAKKIGISFYVLDLRKEFNEKIIEPFIKEYKKGKTPNPCIVCNKKIKFNFLFKELKKIKADFIATGHYARLEESKTKLKSVYCLLRARDKNKDQSYFLWQLNQKILEKTLFPVGGYEKKEVKELAREFNLPVFDISESQEICFIKKTTEDFLKKYIKLKPGEIIDKKGIIIGKHQGVWFYTIGQRKGIKLSNGPFYVLDKDIKKNLLIVSKNKKDLLKKELIAKNINWVCEEPKKFPLKAMATVRYGSKLAEAIIYKEKGKKLKVVFIRPQKAITPGQSVVFYNKEELLGGGIIAY